MLKSYDSRLLHFLLVGATAAGIHIACAWILTAFVFGEARYHVGYFVGMGLSWAFNFVCHVFLTFRVQDRLAARFFGFLVHSVVSNLAQAWLVTTLTGIFGVRHYVPIIAIVILAISLATFVVYKTWLFSTARSVAQRAGSSSGA